MESHGGLLKRFPAAGKGPAGLPWAWFLQTIKVVMGLINLDKSIHLVLSCIRAIFGAVFARRRARSLTCSSLEKSKLRSSGLVGCDAREQ